MIIPTVFKLQVENSIFSEYPLVSGKNNFEEMVDMCPEEDLNLYALAGTRF